MEYANFCLCRTFAVRFDTIGAKASKEIEELEQARALVRWFCFKVSSQKLKLEINNNMIEVFTTRPDTIFFGVKIYDIGNL
jgi:hypothetical protein